jgi:hypothetical protein
VLFDDSYSDRGTVGAAASVADGVVDALAAGEAAMWMGSSASFYMLTLPFPTTCASVMLSVSPSVSNGLRNPCIPKSGRV